MQLEPGKTLLHYRVVEKLGEGGMGVVWKAVDTTLDLEVAIKILPDVFAADPERFARFERKAKVLSSLNHPNIAAIHSCHHSGDVHFLAMELVPGEDLAERLTRGPLPVDTALKIAAQVAEGLEVAHESGVIHRDIKPANIQITPEGQVKILDFGLAKGFETDAPSTDASPTLTSFVTAAGFPGTAAYMSPEQARGTIIDHRVDIWAFGCVLFEMLSGRPLFKGDSVSETLAAVISGEADLGALPPTTPQRIRRLLRLCLQKDPRSRLRDIGDARLEIEETIRGGAEAEAAVEPIRSGRLRYQHLAVIAGASAMAFTLSGVLEFLDSVPFFYSVLPVEFPAIGFLRVTIGVAGGVAGYLLDKPRRSRRRIGR